MVDIVKINLPSGEECEIKEFTAEAERILTNKAEIKSGKWLDKFMLYSIHSLNGVLTSENRGEVASRLLDMKTGDRNYLLLRIRMLNYGEEMVFNYTCPECKKTSGYQVNLQELLDNGELKIYPYREDTPLPLEIRGGVVELDYMTGRSEQWLASQKDIETAHIAMAACKSFNEKPPTYKDFSKFYAKDLMKIRTTYNDEFKGGLDPQVELECSKCDNVYKVMLYQIPDFFIPTTMMVNTGL